MHIIKASVLIAIGVWTVIAFVWHWYADFARKPEPMSVAITSFLITIIGIALILMRAIQGWGWNQ